LGTLCRLSLTLPRICKHGMVTGEGDGDGVPFPSHHFRNLRLVPIVLKKLHGGTPEVWRRAARLGLLFELLLRLVLQRGMQPLPIVILLDELFDVRPQMFQVVVSAGVNFLPFQGLDEAFATGVGFSRRLRLMRTL
jgi:hypothetical protein